MVKYILAIFKKKGVVMMVSGKSRLVFISMILIMLGVLLPGASSEADASPTAAIQPPNKYVGIQYENWFDRYYPLARHVYPNVYTTVNDLEKPLWWAEPEIGFYDSSNIGVIHHHAEQITTAGIDFVMIDISNHNVRYNDLWPPVMIMLNTYKQRIQDGLPTPKVVFLSSYLYPPGITSGPTDLEYLYDRVYRDNLYDEVMFKYGGKPLLLTFPNTSNVGCQQAIYGTPVSHIFECKSANGLANNAQVSCPFPSGAATANNVWSVVDLYPQFTFMNNGWVEQMAVSAAQQANWMGIDNQPRPDARGRKWNQGACANNGYEGQNYDAQWQRAQELNPSFVIISSWNEWIAIALRHDPNQPASYAYTDAYSPEYSKDIEPMKDGFGNYYYARTIQQIAEYKRNSPDLYVYDQNAGAWNIKEGRGGQQLAATNFSYNVPWPGPGGAAYNPLVGDFNNDGMTDIGLRYKDTGMWYFAFANGDGTFGNSRSFQWTADSHPVEYQPLVGDFNNDGLTDIALRRNDTGIWYFGFFDGVSNYAVTRSFQWAADSHPVEYQPVVGDFNTDGLVDIALRRNDTGEWHFAMFDGGGHYAHQRNFQWAADVGTLKFQPLVGDFNCDSLMDIALRQTDTGRIYLANFDGGAQYYNYTNYEAPAGDHILVQSSLNQCTAP